ncbi:MAG: hypothetical protein P8J50_15135 [Acidimicrobiales bacterium]|jgi:hypothetical protein|nr:hypothetical protein [Acidimicrobiales bacterium]
MPHLAPPPILLTDVLDEVGDAVELLARHAPYTPLGGWYNPGADPTAKTRPMWFQNDWVHDTYTAPGSELFLHHPDYIEATKAYFDAEIVEPHSVYVNHMMAIDKAGPCHTDNPRFAGRDRANTPMWVLRTMFWSGLFDDEAIPQATAIWWLNDVDGGALRYWPDGWDEPAVEHGGRMTNTALLGDNHGMFHQVCAVGSGSGTPLVSPSAELGPVDVAGGDWAISDLGEQVFRAPLDEIRVSVLWKADVFRDEAHRVQLRDQPLSLDAVAERLGADADRFDDPDHQAEIVARFPEPRPTDALPSVYDR